MLILCLHSSYSLLCSYQGKETFSQQRMSKNYVFGKRDFERHYANAQEYSGPPSPWSPHPMPGIAPGKCITYTCFKLQKLD